MNELDLLRRLRSDVPELEGDAVDTAEDRVMRTILSPSRRPARRRRGLRPAWAGALTATAAAAVVVAVVVQVTGGPAPHGSSSDGLKMRPVSAVELLDNAALTAERTPPLHPHPGQFIVYESVSTAAAYGADWRYLSRAKVTIWASVDATQEGATSSQVLPPQPYPGWPLPAAANDGVGSIASHPNPICDPHPADNIRTDYAYLSTLPTDPATMLTILKNRRSGDPSADNRAWTAAGDLIRASYLPPAQRAAVFQAAKLIPGVTLVPNVEDAAGRTGIAVARIDNTRGVRDELIFNPTTFQFQGERTFVVDPAKAETAVPVPVPTGKTPPVTTNPGTPAPTDTGLLNTAVLSVTVSDTAPKFPHTGNHCG